jgi:hypothetical protein
MPITTNPIESIVLSPFDEALARQQQPLLSMEEKNDVREEIWVKSYSAERFSSFIRPWKSFDQNEPPSSVWSTHYRNDAYDDRRLSNFTHTIEFTESNSMASTKAFEHDDEADEERGFKYVFSIDHQGPSTSTTMSQRMYIARIAIAIALAGALLLRIMA